MTHYYQMEEGAKCIKINDEVSCLSECSGNQHPSVSGHDRADSVHGTEKYSRTKEKGYSNLVSPQPFVRVNVENVNKVKETDFCGENLDVTGDTNMGTASSSNVDANDLSSTDGLDSQNDSDSNMDPQNSELEAVTVKHVMNNNGSEPCTEQTQLVKQNGRQKSDNLSNGEYDNSERDDDVSHVVSDITTDEFNTSCDEGHFDENSAFKLKKVLGMENRDKPKDFCSNSKISEITENEERVDLQSHPGNSGDISMSDNSGEIIMSANSGDIIMRVDSGDTIVDVNSGDKVMSTQTLESTNTKELDSQTDNLDDVNLICHMNPLLCEYQNDINKCEDSNKVTSGEDDVCEECTHMSQEVEGDEVVTLLTAGVIGVKNPPHSPESHTEQDVLSCDEEVITGEFLEENERTMSEFDNNISCDVNSYSDHDTLETECPANENLIPGHTKMSGGLDAFESNSVTDKSLNLASKNSTNQNLKLSFQDVPNYSAVADAERSFILDTCYSPTGVNNTGDYSNEYHNTDNMNEMNVTETRSPGFSHDENEADINSNDSNIQTLMRQDSSENIVIEIKPRYRTPSPEELPLDKSKSKSMENISPKDYLVFRANRKLALQKQNQPDESKSDESANEKLYGMSVNFGIRDDDGNGAQAIGYKQIDEENKHVRSKYQNECTLDYLLPKLPLDTDVNKCYHDNDISSEWVTEITETVLVDPASNEDDITIKSDIVLQDNNGSINTNNYNTMLLEKESSIVMSLPDVVLNSESDQNIQTIQQQNVPTSHCELLTSYESKFPVFSVVDGKIDTGDSLTDLGRISPVESFDDGVMGIPAEGIMGKEGGNKILNTNKTLNNEGSKALENSVCTAEYNQNDAKSQDGYFVLDQDSKMLDNEDATALNENTDNTEQHSQYDTKSEQGYFVLDQGTSCDALILDTKFYLSDIEEIDSENDSAVMDSDESFLDNKTMTGIQENENQLKSVNLPPCPMSNTSCNLGNSVNARFDNSDVKPQYRNINDCHNVGNTNSFRIPETSKMDHGHMETGVEDEFLPEDKEVEFILSKNIADTYSEDDRSTVSISEDKNSRPLLTPESDGYQGSPDTTMSGREYTEITQSESEFDTAESGDDDFGETDNDLISGNDVNTESDTEIMASDMYFEPLVEESETDLEQSNIGSPVKLPVEKCEIDDHLKFYGSLALSESGELKQGMIKSYDDSCIVTLTTDDDDPYIMSNSDQTGDNIKCHTCDSSTYHTGDNIKAGDSTKGHTGEYIQTDNSSKCALGENIQPGDSQIHLTHEETKPGDNNTSCTNIDLDSGDKSCLTGDIEQAGDNKTGDTDNCIQLDDNMSLPVNQKAVTSVKFESTEESEDLQISSKNADSDNEISRRQENSCKKKRSRLCLHVVNKERRKAAAWNVISPSRVKDKKTGSLTQRKQKLYNFIHKLNTNKHVDFDDSDKDIEDDMIWKLLKGLATKSDSKNELDDQQNGTVSHLKKLTEKTSNFYKNVGKNSTQKDNYPGGQQEKDSGQVEVLTFFSPSHNSKKIEFTPLILSTRKTLPFDVTELFKKELWDVKNKKLSEQMKQLKLITGQQVLIKEKSEPARREVSGDNNKMDLSKNENEELNTEKLEAPLDRGNSQETQDGVVTQSPKVFKMSAAQLILPKLDLISHPSVVLDKKSPIQLPEKELSKEDLNTYVDEKEESTIEEDMGQAEGENNLCVSEMLAQAFEKLNSSRLDEAESQLLRLYQQIQEKPEDNTKILVQTLTSLADICVRRSRMCRSNPMEWQWLCMHSIALLQYTVEVCDSEMESQVDNQNNDWFQEHKHGAELKCRPLEDSFNRALYNCLKHEGRKYMDPFRSFSFPNTPTTPNRLGLFPLSTGRQIFPGMHYKYASCRNDRNETADDMKAGLDWLTKFHRYCNDRIQSKNLGDICNKIFKKRCRVESMNGDNDETASLVSDAGSLDWDHNDLQGIEELDFDPMSANSNVKDHAFTFDLASSDVEDDGWDFFLNDRRSCKFQSVVQVASRKQNHVDKVLNRDLSNIKSTEDKTKELISPLHEHSIKLTLAKTFARLADKLISEEEYEKAEVLLEQVLNIVDEIQDGTAGMLRFSAKIQKGLGTVKSKRGKSSEGLELLNRALQTYKDLQDEESNFEIAVALLELGNGYVVGKSNDDGVYEDAIAAICEFFEKDLSDEQMSSSSSSGKSDIQQRSAEEEENIEEAIVCYKEALSLLDNYQNEKQMDVVAKSTMRLGDCYFMQKDYDQALECFEKALTLFHATSTLGREFVLEHAHVMCMLGVSTFMLHMYPRAGSTFELALHLVKYAFGLNSTFLHGLILSMMGITFYKMKNYHRCVSACYQGFEIFCSLHGDKLPTLPKRKFWLVCQILYVMGNSYNVLNLHQKAIKYLTVARTLMMACKMRERRQFMRVLQILGDCYFAQYDYKTALQFYNEALEYGDCESQISFDEVFDPNAMSDNMTMHNQLVSKSAEAHISMQQYQNAVHYLEQAHDMQEDMGNDIKGDLIHTLNQLGQMHSVAGDVDQAIDSFNESLEVYREIHDGKLGPEMCATLGNLGTMCYVKACISEEIDQELEMILEAEENFQNAMSLEVNPSVSVKYANFLYSQGNYEDAIMYLDDALKIPDINNAPDITYGGLEKVTLPDCLQDEVDCMEEVVLSPTALARYLLILSYKMLAEMNKAEVYLLDLFHDVMSKEIPILYSVLGYSMMEFMLFEDAIWCFDTAIDLECDYQLAIYNYNLCLCICFYRMLINGIENICAFYHWSIFDLIDV